MDTEETRNWFLQQVLSALFQPPASHVPQANDPVSYAQSLERSKRSQSELIANHYLDTVPEEASVEEALAPVPAHLPLLLLNALTPRQATDHDRRKTFYVAYKTRQFRLELPQYDNDIVGRKEALIRFGDECLSAFLGPDWIDRSQALDCRATPSSIYSNASQYPPVSTSFAPPHTCPHGVPIAPSAPVPAMPAASKNPSAPANAATAMPPASKYPNSAKNATSATPAASKSPSAPTNAATAMRAASKSSIAATKAAPVQPLASKDPSASAKAAKAETPPAKEAKQAEQHLQDDLSESDFDDESDYDSELEEEMMYEFMQDRGYWGDGDLDYGLGYGDDPYGLGMEDDPYGYDFDYDPTQDPNFLEYYSMGFDFDEAFEATIEARAERIMSAHFRKDIMMGTAFKGSTKPGKNKKKAGKGKDKGIGMPVPQPRTLGEASSGVGTSKAPSSKDGSVATKKKAKRKRKGKGKAKSMGKESGGKGPMAAGSTEGVKANHNVGPSSVVKSSVGRDPVKGVSQAPASSSGKDGAGTQFQQVNKLAHSSLAHHFSPTTLQGSPGNSIASVGLGLAGSSASVRQPIPIKVSLPTPSSSRAATGSAPKASTSTSSASKVEANQPPSAMPPKAAGKTKRKRTDTSTNSSSSVDKPKAPAKVAKNVPAAANAKQKKQPKFEVFVWKKRYRPSQRPYRDCWHAAFRA